ncbi:hypothetical protein OSC27_05035 [Microbacterium sp. STN6]|uniref:hypothetical protein n=1 Tax=Microbacterium sp. STN6 TaxID=2995588 RepID=UPI002260AE96|nr:hypothetical protein [Microbacterium sp. STN6]MCX7521642.1 hypothetical protein [Microbacterium sp. STN6]
MSDDARGLGPLLRRPLRRRAILLVLASAAIGALFWYIGMDAGHAATVSIAIAALGVVWIAVPREDHPAWAPDDEEQPHEGVRRDVTRLSWSLRPGRAGIAAEGLRRIQSIADRRLGRLGLSLDEPTDRPAIEHLLGRRALHVLRPPGAPPRIAAVAACLDAIDRLPADAGATPTEKRT